MMKKLLSVLAVLAIGLSVLLAVNWRVAMGDQALREGAQLIELKPDVRIAVTDEGRGPAVVLVPSLGRGAADFDDLTAHLVDAGYRVIRPDPRQIAGSEGPAPESLNDLADDIIGVMDALDVDQAVIAGHAFGNRVARVVATNHPNRVRKIVLLAAGGKAPMKPGALQALNGSFDTLRPTADHLKDVAFAFFAEGNDPAVWQDGWYTVAAMEQGAANAATPVKSWWGGGGKPMLVIQPAEDAVAPVENAEDLKARFPDRVEVVVIEKAGHALLPEQPAKVAAALIHYLNAD